MTNEPVTIVEIEQDVCSLTFGVSPCTATGTPCYNTWKTCKDKPNFDEGVRVLRFAKPRVDLPLSWNVIPSLKSTSSSPTQLNVGDVDASSGPLGKRAQATISFQDHPTSDIQQDPYVAQRGVNPFEVGTFWSKLKARWPYFNGRKIRILDGYINQDIEDMQKREFFIDSLDGPDSSGNVTIRGIDPLRSLDDKKSNAPAQSTGELLNAIDSTQTSFTVTNAALDSYPLTGTLRIGGELMTYTSRVLSGSNIVFSGITRGTDGSVAAQQNAETRVQTCLRYTDVPAWQVAKSLIETYAPSAYDFVDVDQWTAEGTLWLDQFIVSSVISEPTGVNQLIGELCRDAQFFVWWDERNQKILLQAVRPPTVDPVRINEEANIIAGSQSIVEKENERISQIWYYYQPKDFSKSLTDESNFKKVRIRIDSAAESVREYADSSVKRIYSRWVRTDAIVISITTRLLDRYRDPPFYLTISCDAKDRSIWTADVLDVTTRLVTDVTGAPTTTRYQVIEAEEVMSGSVIQYVLQNFNYLLRFAYYMADGSPVFTLASDTEKQEGAWWSDDEGKMSDSTNGYTYQ
jgi:hypothetical protein